MSHFENYFNDVNSFFVSANTEHVIICKLCGAKKEDTYNRLHEKLYRCHTCGFTWLARQPTQDVLDEFYEKSDAMSLWSEIKSTGVDDDRQNDKFKLFWDFILKKRIDSVLDIGCGTGYFGNRINEHTLVIGTEKNKDSAQHCQFKVSNNYPKRKDFSMITAFGILEHIKEPGGFIDEATRYIHKDGFFGVIVPNLDSLAFQVLGRDNCSICPQHLNYFTISSLVDLFTHSLYSLVSYRTVEEEYQPICRKLAGVDPYSKGVEFTTSAFKRKDILKHNQGAKICAIFKRGL